MTGRSTDALAGLLAHPDMRVRQEAQFELAGRGEEGWKTLARIAGSEQETLPRIHALWGLEQASRRTEAGRRASLWSTLAPLLADPEPEVRAQAAKVAGACEGIEVIRGADRPARRPQPAGSLLRRDRPGQAGPCRCGRASC